MNDEIKEIFNDTKEFIKDLDDKSIYGIPIGELRQLLDYITNLQQIEQDHKQTNATLMSELAKLEEENERLNLELSGYREAILRDDKLLGLQDYKFRCKKAIEYYKMHQQECVISRNRDDKLIKDYYLPAQHSKVLLNILQNGSDSQ